MNSSSLCILYNVNVLRQYFFLNVFCFLYIFSLFLFQFLSVINNFSYLLPPPSLSLCLLTFCRIIYVAVASIVQRFSFPPKTVVADMQKVGVCCSNDHIGLLWKGLILLTQHFRPQQVLERTHAITIMVERIVGKGDKLFICGQQNVLHVFMSGCTALDVARPCVQAEFILNVLVIRKKKVLLLNIYEVFLSSFFVCVTVEQKRRGKKTCIPST